MILHLIHCLCTKKETIYFNKSQFTSIELLNNKSHGLLPPGGFSFLSFDQAVPYYSQPIGMPSKFCIDKTVPGFLDVIPFLSLDVAIFVVLQLNKRGNKNI